MRVESIFGVFCQVITLLGELLDDLLYSLLFLLFLPFLLIGLLNAFLLKFSTQTKVLLIGVEGKSTLIELDRFEIQIRYHYVLDVLNVVIWFSKIFELASVGSFLF